MKFKKISLYILGLTFFNVNPSFAIEPQIKESDIITPKPNEVHSISTQRVTSRLTTAHYRKINLNDEFSNKILNRYIDWLDGSHKIFLQSDIDELNKKYAHIFDDELYQGKLESAYHIYDLMNKRLYQRYRYLLTLVDKEPNLTLNDEVEKDREKAPFPKTTQEAEILWQQRFKNDVINQYLKNKTWKKTQEKLTKRYNLAIRRLTQTNADDILQLFLNAFAREIDPHTSYFSPRSAKRFEESMKLSLEGIGATLYLEDDVTTIKSLVKGAPADRSKQIYPDDKIVGVGQEKGEIEDVVGWRIDDVVDKIKGKKGTKVRLEIEPAKGGKNRLITLVRDTVKLEDSAAKLTIDKVNGKKVAVIEIPSFYIGLAQDVQKLLIDVNKKKIQGLIIDLRNNGGGSLKEVIRLTGLFIKQGPVVQVRDAKHKIKVYIGGDDKNVLYKENIIVMINRHSASASEIFAAAMQDYNRAIIVGQTTFGKGTVQQGRGLNTLFDKEEEQFGMLQYTIQKFYRISGGSTQQKGVEPDIPYPEIINKKEVGESFEDNALAWDKIPTLNYQQDRNARLFVKTLTEKHLKRIAKNPEFIALNKDIEAEREEDEKKFLSLNLEQRKKERKRYDDRLLNKLNARFKREGKKTLKDLDDLAKDYEAPDFILTETKKIVVDWLESVK